MSHHIGDLENYETLRSFEDGIEHFEHLFRVHPQALAYDLHPNYLATRYAVQRASRENLPSLGVQHHHAHIASAMAEHKLDSSQYVLGVAFDGIGYGDDGALWGGEFLLASYAGYKRLAHLAYTPLPGGDLATRKPARNALAHLWQAGLDWDPELPCVAVLCTEERTALRSQLEHHLNSPLTSSIGRLFDAVSALANVRQQVNYEAQAAIELETLVDPDEKGDYPFDITSYDLIHGGQAHACLRIDPGPLVRAVVNDVYAQIAPSVIAARFHNSLARLTLEVCQSLRLATSLDMVVLSGGVWQNMRLLTKTWTNLQQAGFTVLTHRLAPANDGGLALGQAAIAADYFRNRL
jgi:hydrogenase maturation protein HypF